jgi:hypothetical protein
LIRSNDYTSGLSRRRVSIFFDQNPPSVENLIDLSEDHITGIFADELESFINYIVQIDSQIVNKFMKDLPNNTTINSLKYLVKLNTNPIYYFIKNEILIGKD